MNLIHRFIFYKYKTSYQFNFFIIFLNDMTKFAFIFYINISILWYTQMDHFEYLSRYLCSVKSSILTVNHFFLIENIGCNKLSFHCW